MTGFARGVSSRRLDSQSRRHCGRQTWRGGGADADQPWNGLPAYVLTVAPLRTGFLSDERQLAMIVVVDPVRHTPSETDLAEFFGLSPAEARVAAALLTGKTLAEIAAIFGIRITTVRTQLASILRKVGAERQADLVRILSSTGIGSVCLTPELFDIALVVVQLPASLAGV
jgi:DNA-binding CsgD family transcriptional regulator